MDNGCAQKLVSLRVVLRETAANLNSRTPQEMQSLSPPRDVQTRIHRDGVRQDEGASVTTRASQRHIHLLQKVTRSPPSFSNLCRPFLRFANHLHYSDTLGSTLRTQRQPTHNVS